jgi:hypothetical protein
MARQVIKATSDRFKTIQEGLQTCLIHRNDRLWTTYDEIWFAECDKNEQTTGRVIRVRVTHILFGEMFGLEAAHVLISYRPADSGIASLPVMNFTYEQISAVTNECRETLLDPDSRKQEVLF